MCNFIRRKYQTTFGAVVTFCIPIKNKWEVGSAISPTFHIDSFCLFLIILMGSQLCLMVVLSYMFLITNDTEQLSRLPVIYHLWQSVRSDHLHVCFFVWVICLLLVNFRHLLYTLDISPLPVYNLQIFSCSL